MRAPVIRSASIVRVCKPAWRRDETDLGILHDVPVDGLLVLSVDLRSLDQLVLELLDAVL